MKQTLSVLLSLIVLAGILLTACGGTHRSPVAPATKPLPQLQRKPQRLAGCCTEPVAFPDGGKSVVGAWDRDPIALSRISPDVLCDLDHPVDHGWSWRMG